MGGVGGSKEHLAPHHRQNANPPKPPDRQPSFLFLIQVQRTIPRRPKAAIVKSKP